MDNDLLAVPGGDAPELQIVHGDVDRVADFVDGGNFLRLLQRDFVEGVDIVFFVDDILLDEHPQSLGFLVRFHFDVFGVGVVFLVGGDNGLNDFFEHERLGDAAVFLQQLQRRENLRRIHARGFFLLPALRASAFHGKFSLHMILFTTPRAGEPAPCLSSGMSARAP